jgi:hypothetical protein
LRSRFFELLMVFPAWPESWLIPIFAVSRSSKLGKIFEFLKFENRPAAVAGREKGCY